MLGRQFPEDSLEEWKPNIFMDNPTLIMSNRYFTEKRLCPHGEAIPFRTDIDPKGILQKMTGVKLVHTQENHVDYYELLKESNGNQQHQS